MRNFKITVNGTTYEVGVEEIGGTAVPSAPFMATPVSAPVATSSAAPAPVVADNGEKLLSPFPGLIKGLLVENGAQVKKDQPVLVLEAMKMDNDITAPCDGKITFNVQKGSNVESDTVLAIIG